MPLNVWDDIRLTNFSDLSSCATKRLIFGQGFQLVTAAWSMILFEGWGRSFVGLRWHYRDRSLKRLHYVLCKKPEEPKCKSCLVRNDWNHSSAITRDRQRNFVKKSVERFRCLCFKFLFSGIIMYVSDTNLANNLGVRGECQKVDRKLSTGCSVSYRRAADKQEPTHPGLSH